MTAEQIEQDRAAAIARLHDSKGRQNLPDHMHQEQVTAIDKAYQQALAHELNTARELAAEADRIALEAHSDPSSWLTPEELTAANARASFVREDIAQLDPGALLNRARQALAAGDKPLAWLMLRYMPTSLDDYSPSLHHELQQVRAALETAVKPAAAADATKRANAQRLAAEERRVAAAVRLHKATGDRRPFNPFAAEYR
jgi:hypothetical protein